MIIYLLVMTMVLILRGNGKTKFSPYPKLKIKDDGISFYSTKRHRLRIGRANVMQVGSTIHLQQDKIYITLVNVDRVYTHDGYMYFNGLGDVRVVCNMRRVKRYFALRIDSDMLEVSAMQERAKVAMINHLFNMNECKELKEYISLISRVLNIRFAEDKIIVSKNKYNIPYTLYYKVHNVIKKVNVLGTK